MPLAAYYLTVGLSTSWRGIRLRLGEWRGLLLWAAVAGVGFLNGIGQVLMRVGGRDQPFAALFSAHGLVNHPVWWAGMALAWCCGLSWAWLVTRVSLGLAIPLNVAAFWITAVLASHLWLGETLTLRQIAGFALVIAGISLLGTARAA